MDTKLIWAEKTYEEEMSKILAELKNEQIQHAQNQEILNRTQNEREEREAKIKAEMKDKILGIQKGIEASNQEIKRLRDDKQKLLEENMQLTENLNHLQLKEDTKIMKTNC